MGEGERPFCRWFRGKQEGTIGIMLFERICLELEHSDCDSRILNELRFDGLVRDVLQHLALEEGRFQSRAEGIDTEIRHSMWPERVS